MTTVETAFFVALVLVLVVGPFAWMVVSGLRHSDETYEPRFQPRTYQTSARDFFLTMDSGLVVFLTAMGLFFVHFLLKSIDNQSECPDWTVYAFFGLLILVFFGVSVYFLILDLNYWKYTKDRILAFDPESRTLTVQTDEDEYMIGESDVEQVDVFSNENYRNLREYYVFKLRDGRELIITDKTKGAYAIFDFFQNLPTHRHKRSIPTISRENSQSA